MKIRQVTGRAEALALAPALERYADAAMREFRDTPLYALRYRPVPFAVGPPDKFGRRIVAADRFAGWVEVQRPLRAAGNVGQVHERRGEVPFFDVRGRPAARAHAIEEVLMMGGQVGLAGPLSPGWFLGPKT